MRIGKYLDALQCVSNCKSDIELAKKYGWSHSVPSHWRTGKRFMDNQTAALVSERINVPVIEIIAAIEADREEVSGQNSFWTDFFQKTTATAASIVLAIVAAGSMFVSPDTAAKQGFESLAMRAKPRQPQSVGIRLPVDQQQVGLDVTFAVARPIARKIVVAITRIQRLIGRQCNQHRLERVIERGSMLALSLPLVVALERGGTINRPHASPPSSHRR